MSYLSTKVIELGSCAFRQPFANSHCKFLHGYRLIAKFQFACDQLDSNNWVVDFGSLKDLKSILEFQFDHTTVVTSSDPQIELFRTLNERGVVDLRIMDGVGIEKFAEYCFKVADRYIREKTNYRCWVQSCEVWEHEKNSAIYTSLENVSLKETVATQDTKEVPITKQEKVEQPKSAKEQRRQPIPAPVGNPVDKSNNLSFKSALDGLQWGKKQ